MSKRILTYAHAQLHSPISVFAVRMKKGFIISYQNAHIEDSDLIVLTVCSIFLYTFTA